MENINRKVFFLSLVMAILFTGVLYTVLKKNDNTPNEIKTVKAFVASKGLAERHKVLDKDVREINIPHNVLHKDAILKKQDIIGKYTRGKMFEGDQFIKVRLAKTFDEAYGIKIPSGKRLLSLSVSEGSVVSFAPQKGDRVDIIATIEDETKIIAQNIELIFYGVMTEEAQKLPKESSKNATFIVTPQEAERLTMAEAGGKIKMILRSPADEALENTLGAKKLELLR